MGEEKMAQDLFAGFVLVGGFAFLWILIETAKSIGEKALGTLSIIVCAVLTLLALAGQLPGVDTKQEQVQSGQPATWNAGR